MPTAEEPRREHPSTYFVQDRQNQEEVNRLMIQDHMMTSAMGGVLPEQANPAQLQSVLDVGCGTGGWLIELAKAYPDIPRLVGVDVNGRMLDVARTQADAQQVGDRVEFLLMDALRMLEFPSGSFDVVNQRLGDSYLRTWDWPKLLQEFQRVARSRGTIRVTEGDAVESTSPALTRFTQLFVQAFYQAGHLFTPKGDGVISELPHLLHQHGFQNVQTHAHCLVYRAGTPEGELFREDSRRFLRTMTPFLRKWTHVPDDYEHICQQALEEMQQPDFVATLRLL